MARELRARLTPWVHAAAIGLVAGLASLEGLAQRLGGVWLVVALVVVSRGLGAGLAQASQLPRRRATQKQLLEDLKVVTRRLVGATHGLTSQASIIVAEIDLLLEQLHDNGRDA